MKIRGKKEEVEREKKLVGENEEKAEKKEKKKHEYSEGSRYTALWLLLFTLIVGFWFYLAGRGGITAVLKDLGEQVPNWLTRTYRF